MTLRGEENPITPHILKYGGFHYQPDKNVSTFIFLDAVIFLHLHLLGSYQLTIFFVINTNIVNINNLISSWYQVFHM